MRFVRNLTIVVWILRPEGYYRRDHNLERKDGHVRSEEVPTEGWCRHLQSRRSGGLVPMLNYDLYKAGLA